MDELQQSNYLLLEKLQIAEKETEKYIMDFPRKLYLPEMLQHFNFNICEYGYWVNHNKAFNSF